VRARTCPHNAATDHSKKAAPNTGSMSICLFPRSDCSGDVRIKMWLGTDGKKFLPLPANSI
jgi:hypothetical protein